MSLGRWDLDIKNKAQNLLDAEQGNMEDRLGDLVSIAEELSTIGDPFSSRESINLVTSYMDSTEELGLILKRLKEYQAIVNHYNSLELLS